MNKPAIRTALPPNDKVMAITGRLEVSRLSPYGEVMRGWRLFGCMFDGVDWLRVEARVMRVAATAAALDPGLKFL